MKYDVIILAGGLGTRLRSVVSDLPKPMAEVAGRPFLHYILKSLNTQDIGKIVLSVGYQHQKVMQYVGEEFNGIPIHYAVEEEPLGTGGGIALAMKHCTADQVVILNGDTYFGIEFTKLFQEHEAQANELTLGVKYMQSPDRYGAVILEPKSGRVLHFKEKQDHAPPAFINAGVYLLNRKLANHFPKEDKWSFEKDFLEQKRFEIQIGSAASAALFIDIGIPEDYHRAQELFAVNPNAKDWSNHILLLDRDGVINKPRAGDYVKSAQEFEWTKQALEALYLLRKSFKEVYVVTNQQGIGRQIMSEEDLEDIHLSMYKVLKYNDIGYFDSVFYAPYLAAEGHPWRKPGTGMPEKAGYGQKDKQDWVMVGDSPGDMQMGGKIKALRVRIENPQFEFNNQDLRFDSLYQFALYITQI